MAFYAFDGDSWSCRATFEEAKKDAQDAIDELRLQCDPEWPDCVEDVAVYEAPDDSEEPDEDGALLLRTLITDIRDAEPGDRVDFWCDYVLAPPRADQMQGRAGT